MVWRWGHKVICEIAFRLAEPETLARIRRLIRNDPGYDFFSDSYPWPDHPKLRRNEHFGRKSPPSLRSVRRRPCAAAWSASPRADLAIIDPFAASGCEGGCANARPTPGAARLPPQVRHPVRPDS